MKAIFAKPGDVVQIPGVGNFVWILQKKDDPCSGRWKRMTNEEWDEYASQN